MNVYRLKLDSWVIHENIFNEFCNIKTSCVKQESHVIWCTDKEIIERGELFKIKKSFYPDNFFCYVRPEDLLPVWLP